jgi:hypothetical protein
LPRVTTKGATSLARASPATHTRRKKRLKHRGTESTEKEKDNPIVSPDEKLEIFENGDPPIRILPP